MGFNTWDRFACKGINAEVMMQSADLMVSTGLKAAGYLYVNLDGCWQAPGRINGKQHPDPAKFPQGLPPVVAHIHSLGLKAGIYTALANRTCGSGPGACLNEAVDAKQYADWLFDYVKDDACGACRPGLNGTLEDYAAMQAGISATGRPMILSIEAQPDVRTVSAGGHGNLRRVGHDINPTWRSMSSLIDMDSGLYPFAHNASVSPTGNGYFNDLDIMEIGNGVFNPVNDSWPPGAVDFARAHFSMWSILKGALLLGNDFTKMSSATLAIVSNRHAISINQDPVCTHAFPFSDSFLRYTTLTEQSSSWGTARNPSTPGGRHSRASNRRHQPNLYCRRHRHCWLGCSLRQCCLHSEVRPDEQAAEVVLQCNRGRADLHRRFGRHALVCLRRPQLARGREFGDPVGRGGFCACRPVRSARRAEGRYVDSARQWQRHEHSGHRL